jgi:3-oxoacyl-[acyl-carrier-protein] synthase II
MSTDTFPKRKVVVTGLGVVSQLGLGAEEFFSNLCDGVSGIQRLPKWADEFPCKVGVPLTREFKIKDYMDPKEAKRQARFTHFAMAAARMAIDDSKIDVKNINQFKFGALVGSGVGGVEFFEQNLKKFEEAGQGQAGWKKVSPFLIPGLIADTATGLIAIEFGAKGPNFGVVSACATGTHAIGTALGYIQTGVADVMLAGGSEASLTPFCFTGFDVMTAMCRDFNDEPQRASRPFDAKRAGFVMAEGAGVVLLESEEHAKGRGASIYCELAGFGASCDAHHITAPHPEGEGLATCMASALDMAGLKETDVDYVNAHGTSTPYNDKFETNAIKRVFGEHAYKLKISSIKGQTGHSLGAAGGLEAVCVAKVIQKGIIPPSINYEYPDPELDLDYVPNKAVKMDVKVAVSDNLGFGGHNGALIFKKYEPSPQYRL